MELTQVITIEDEIRKINKPWSPVEIAKVNDQVLRLAMFKGSYPMHKHANEEELFYVLKGKITIRLENNQEIVLNQGEMTVIPIGVMHSPLSETESYVLMFEPISLISSGD